MSQSIRLNTHFMRLPIESRSLGITLKSWVEFSCIIWPLFTQREKCLRCLYTFVQLYFDYFKIVAFIKMRSRYVHQLPHGVEAVYNKLTADRAGVVPLSLRVKVSAGVRGQLCRRAGLVYSGPRFVEPFRIAVVFSSASSLPQ